MILLEIWKDVQGYEGLYQVSNLGRVRSMDRWRKNGTNGYIQKGRILKQEISNCGYSMVHLSFNGKVKGVLVHRLVAIAFIPNPQNKEQVNHIDGRKQNNNTDNLEWATQSENTIHAHKKGLMTSNAKKREVYCFQTNKTYPSIIQASAELGIHASGIGRVCRGEQKQTKGYTFKYL